MNRDKGLLNRDITNDQIEITNNLTQITDI